MKNYKHYIVCSVGILKTLVSPGSSLTMNIENHWAMSPQGGAVPKNSSLGCECLWFPREKNAQEVFAYVFGHTWPKWGGSLSETGQMTTRFLENEKPA